MSSHVISFLYFQTKNELFFFFKKKSSFTNFKLVKRFENKTNCSFVSLQGFWGIIFSEEKKYLFGPTSQVKNRLVTQVCLFVRISYQTMYAFWQLFFPMIRYTMDYNTIRFLFTPLQSRQQFQNNSSKCRHKHN